MDPNEPASSSLLEKVRNISVSRRGGVRTRGGRLPPITVRDLPHLSSTKKTIAPKIPQRRVVVKKEQIEATPLIKKEPIDVQNDCGRGRGRGKPPKVYVQLEGTFLADGPALKIKKEREDTGYSIARSTKTSARQESKIDSEKIRDLLSYYDENGAYDDSFDALPPNRLPLLKDKLAAKIKSEDANLEETNIKIKKEKDSPDEKVITKLEPKVESEFESFLNAKDEGMLILLQWPSCLPITREQVVNEDNAKEIEVVSRLNKLPEGQVGKFQILKSGKKRLILGSLAFEVFEGTESETCKEIASVRIEKDGGDIAVMGKIDRTVILRPIIENLYTIN